MIDPRPTIISKRLASIDRVIAVASGKGGVGKSMVSSGLALSLSKKGYTVGLLDLDLYGPSSHIILGVKPKGFPEENQGIIPPLVHGIKFMSIVYFTEDKPGAFRGIDITNIIIELLTITKWGSLDYLIIDMPPGIGDEFLDVLGLIKPCEFLLVTTPSKVAMGAVMKLTSLLTELKAPILGTIENMQLTEKSAKQEEQPKKSKQYLGSVRFDTSLEETIGKPEKFLQTSFMKDLQSLIDPVLSK